MPMIPEEVFVPQCRVFIDGTQIKASAEMIESVTVQLTASEMANGCEFVIFCKYDHDRSTMGNIISRASAGKKVRVELGYKLPKPVFIGYINSTSVDFSAEGISLIVSCLDARGLLMGNVSRESFENKSVSQIVTQLLDPIKSYTEGVTVSIPGSADKEYPLSQYEMDDYRYICMLARLTGCSFYMAGTKLKFVKDIFSTSTLKASYTWGKDLISFSRTVELSEQLGKVRVIGTVPDTLEDFFADASPISGSGKTGASLCSPVKSKVKEVVCKTIKSQKEAKVYAESLMRQSCLKLCRGNARVVGNEALVPGSRIKFGGLDPKLNGTYFITGVQHTFNGSGFLTNISFCAPTD